MKLLVSKTREPSATRATFTGPGLIWHDTFRSPLQYLRAVPSHCRAPARNAKKTQANKKCNKGNQTWETGLNWRGQLGPHNSNCHVPCGLGNFHLYNGAAPKWLWACSSDARQVALWCLTIGSSWEGTSGGDTLDFLRYSGGLQKDPASKKHVDNLADLAIEIRTTQLRTC